jgi:transcription-repair coupling factor (superfamily II helicase)
MMNNTLSSPQTLSPLQPPPLPKPGSMQQWSQLYGAGLSLTISQCAQQRQGLMLVVTMDGASATRIETELKCFLHHTDIRIHHFPDWETLPYDHFSPHQDIISQRLYTLAQLPLLTHGIIIAPISTLMQRIAPTDYVQANSFVLNVADHFDVHRIRETLQKFGYYAVSQVVQHGEFCLRGAIFDVFPMGSPTPLRIELFDDTIESIRTFDAETQRTLQKITHIHLLPAREYPMDKEAITVFKQQWRDNFSGNPLECAMYQNVSQGVSSAGIEYYLPLFFQTTSSLLDYLPANSCLVLLEHVIPAAEHFWQEIQERYQQYHADRRRPLLQPAQLYIPINELLHHAKNLSQLRVHYSLQEKSTVFNCSPPPALFIQHRQSNPLSDLCDFVNHFAGRILFCVESAGRREALLNLLTPVHIFPIQYPSWDAFLKDNAKIGIFIAPLEYGLLLETAGIALIAETQLFGEHVIQRRRHDKTARQNSENIIKNLSELTLNAPVVHIDHGVGRYLGLQMITSNQIEAEYLTLEYDGGDKLYVPIASLHLIARYSGVDIENAPLHRLGGKQWQKAKEKAMQQVCDVAAELLAIYAERAKREGLAFAFDENAYQTFADAFPFEETPDQKTTITQILNDMRSTKPMDRLVCGDVGFGKTEVAMRAAFVAVNNNKQVAILVPTTLLAQQHFETFSDRFANWPIHVEMLSRFRSAKQQKNILQQLAEGKVDIIIGTHRLIQKDIEFKQLGLLIIDEEHRFGVRQKERLKAMRAEVDIITLTATPIPRTLNMAMAGVRDLSIIATPPARRLSIKTFVHEYNDSLVREAILREILRGGQVYFLHNKVENIERITDKLRELVPEAQFGIAHGQMHEHQLERVMSDFYHQRFNILICTTIIETGIDVPTANTIIINRADRFGLAQLHQLRGRVGRSHHQAYAYLMTGDKASLTRDAEQRLDAIASLEDLGVGFTLATHDLEIRGAGEFLGSEQSGSIQSIGFALYNELLEKSVQALQSGEPFIPGQLSGNSIEIDLNISALIPESYLGDVHTRLMLYKRIANANHDNELDELRVEMIDRFGLLPEPTKNLLALTALKLKAQPIGICKLEAGPHGGRIEFTEKTTVDPLCIANLVRYQPKIFQFDGAMAIRFKQPSHDAKQRITLVNHIMQQLTESTHE